MRREVEEERLSSLDWHSNKIVCKVAVCILQIQEVHWLLLDDLIVHEWNSYSAHITQAETLYIRRKTGQILTGSLRKTMKKINIYMNKSAGTPLAFHHSPCHGSKGCRGTGQTPAWWEEMSRLPRPQGATCPQQQWHSPEVSVLQRW